MKKRVFMFAMVVAMLLSFSVSAWAEDPPKYWLTNTVAGYKMMYNVNAKEGSNFAIPVQAQVSVSTKIATYITEVDKVKITYEVDSNSSFQNVKIGEKKDGSDGKDGSITLSVTETTPETYPHNAYLTGTVKANGTITVKSVLMSGNIEKSTSDITAVIVFTTEKGEDIVDPAFMVDGPNEDATKVASTKVADEADPDYNNDKWNGIDPTYPTSGTMGGNGNDKPSIKTSKLVFTGDDYKGDGSDKVLKSGSPAEFEIEIQGPGPLIDVYVSAKDAKKLWPLECDPKLGGEEPEEDIKLTRDNIKKWKIPFRVTEADISDAEEQDKNTKHTLKIAYNGAQVAYKGFPITVSVANDKTEDSKGVQKPVTKTYKIDIVSSRQVPQWVTATGQIGEKLAKNNSQEISVSLGSGGTLGGTIYTVSADGPYYITAKEDTMGMSADVIQPELNRFGEVVTPGYVKVHGKFDDGDKGTKGGTKEVKVAFTLDAVGSVKKTTFKPTVIGKVSPYFEAKNLVSSSDKDVSYAGLPKVEKTDYEGYYKVKTAEAGKVPSVKFAAKGSKTITYSITSEQKAALNDVGLDFDEKKGQVVQLTDEDNKKVPTEATVTEGEYSPIQITVTADNGTGTTATVDALVGVTGAKAKPYLGKGDDGKELKNLVIQQNSEADTIIPIGSIVGKNVATKDSNDVNVQFRLADAKNKKEGKDDTGIGEDTYALEELGLELIPYEDFTDEQKAKYRNHGLLKVGSGGLTATKGTKVNFILSNFGNEQKGTVNIVIQDPKPVIIDEDTEEDSANVELINGETVTVNLTLSQGIPSNNAKIKWAIADKLSGSEKSNITVTLSNPKEGEVTDYTRATLEITAKKDKIKGSVEDFLTITAKNEYSNQTSEKFKVTLTMTPSGGGGDDEGETSTEGTQDGNNDGLTIGETTALEDDIVTDEELTAELGEGEVTLGAERTVGMLTDAQAKVLDDGRFVIAAILPEISATADGQYGLEVDLAENVKPGAKLYWFAFPKDAPDSEDDTIIDFFEVNGTDTEVVPENRVVVAYPWFRAGVTYGPVIAVKAEDAESGDALTEGELEGTAETKAAE
jgi:hypothetical protein